MGVTDHQPKESTKYLLNPFKNGVGFQISAIIHGGLKTLVVIASSHNNMLRSREGKLLEKGRILELLPYSIL